MSVARAEFAVNSRTSSNPGITLRIRQIWRHRRPMPRHQHDFKPAAPRSPLWITMRSAIPRLFADILVTERTPDAAQVTGDVTPVEESRNPPPSSWSDAKHSLLHTMTARLKFFLQVLNVSGISNAVNDVKISAIGARMVQHSHPCTTWRRLRLLQISR
jgi:hypothetical protein